MPVSLSCPDCGKRFKVSPESAAKGPKCKYCQVKLVEPEDDDEEVAEAPTPKPRKKKKSQEADNSQLFTAIAIGVVLLGCVVAVLIYRNPGGAPSPDLTKAIDSKTNRNAANNKEPKPPVVPAGPAANVGEWLYVALANPGRVPPPNRAPGTVFKVDVEIGRNGRPTIKKELRLIVKVGVERLIYDFGRSEPSEPTLYIEPRGFAQFKGPFEMWVEEKPVGNGDGVRVSNIVTGE